eukprot:CAMPEP_0181486472 /NCGR_PEP_ID=MMETSP1110-20121109/47188_1 /TAXON_ID=174948 /ORGANISM="Symbiodinium sp., Strain CCMP421" /LENGTH=94 /DNA_ID=CAMNT_0023612683 /DNA_START=150 /DNA_END=431 /DNA_ORIENTATION=-
MEEHAEMKEANQLESVSEPAYLRQKLYTNYCLLVVAEFFVFSAKPTTWQVTKPACITGGYFGLSPRAAGAPGHSGSQDRSPRARHTSGAIVQNL